MRCWTTGISIRRDVAAALIAALLALLPWAPASAAIQVDPQALYRQMKAAYAKGAAAGWHLADQLDYFSTVLDAGRAYELRRRDEPENLALKGVTVDLATLLHYDPLINTDAADWYVRLAAQAFVNDPQRGAAAQALLAKLTAEDTDPKVRAHDADADAQALVAAYPGDVQALLGVVEAAIEYDAADGGKSGEDVEGLLATVRRKDVELGGFDHKLAGRDAAGELSVDDEKAVSDHGSIRH